MQHLQKVSESEWSRLSVRKPSPSVLSIYGATTNEDVTTKEY